MAALSDRFKSLTLKDILPIGLIGLIVTYLLLLPSFARNDYTLHVWIVAFFYAILASSWALLSGYAGQFSFAHMAFMGIGAYTSGLLGRFMGFNVLSGIIIGTIMAGVFGLIAGALVLRLRRTYLALFTIAFSEILRLVLMAEHAITEGPDGLPMEPLVATTSKVPPYYIHLALLVASLAFMYWLANSRFGLFFRSIREDEEAAAAMGVHVVRYKIMVFVITSMVAGLAGAVHFHYNEIITPNSILILQMSIVITMAVIGGIESLFASAIGAIIIQHGLEQMRPIDQAFSEWLLDVVGWNTQANWRLVVFGLGLMLTLRFFQNGLLHPVFDYLFRRQAREETVSKRVAEPEVEEG
ncbi:MAG: branched-chain amino acid ABC transporter permease [Anaerolineae bacterium]|nr:branched-chain amino acid ABC transporter permease [Anaerolineae bacterium]